jgi:hypothetical protein
MFDHASEFNEGSQVYNSQTITLNRRERVGSNAPRNIDASHAASI